MYYEQLKKMKIQCNHRNVLKLMGFSSEEESTLVCWSSNSNNSAVSLKYNVMLPNRFWVSIKGDMLYICKSGFNGKVLSYYANIEIKNIKFVKKIEYTYPSYEFLVTNESGEYEFTINPLTTDDLWYAEEITNYISKYNSKELTINKSSEN